MQKRTWQGAVDECCARGGYLATFLDPDFDELIKKAANKTSPTIGEVTPAPSVVYQDADISNVWVGAVDSNSEGNIVWCLPGGGNLSIKSPLSSEVFTSFACYFEAVKFDS
jgi:hypothetical protein